MAKTVHWLEDPDREREPAHEHINVPRISADTMVKLIQLRNSLSGQKMTVFEVSQKLEEEQL